jgi:hypothetical protein
MDSLELKGGKRGDQDVEGLGEEGDGRAEFNFHDE